MIYLTKAIVLFSSAYIVVMISSVTILLPVHGTFADSGHQSLWDEMKTDTLALCNFDATNISTVIR